MFFNRAKEYKITGEELNKVKEELQALQKENEELKKRCNYEHLIRELEEQKRINYLQSNEIQKLVNKVESLNKTIINERSTLSAVLKTLDESSRLCANTVLKYNINKQLEYVSLIDIKG